MKRRIVVTGTDTNIGKTIFAAALAGALDAHYYKPIQAGLEESTDSEIVARLSGLGSSKIVPETYRLTTPASPHVSAEIDGIELDINRLVVPKVSGSLVIEGAGGLMVPLTRDYLLIELLAWWKLPVVLCARTELGTINHSLLSLKALVSYNIPVLGITFIGDENLDTQETICQFGNVSQLGRLPLIERLNQATLKRAFEENFDLTRFKET